MIILDTNVVSELMKPRPATAVVEWMAGHPAPSLYTTSITQAEILHGLKLLPQGRRRSALEAAALSMFAEDFGDRILGFGRDAAPPFGDAAAGPSPSSPPRSRPSPPWRERRSPPGTSPTSMAAA